MNEAHGGPKTMMASGVQQRTLRIARRNPGLGAAHGCWPKAVVADPFFDPCPRRCSQVMVWAKG